MTAACFFRYAWIAPERFEALLPPSAACERLSAHLALGAELAGALPAAALRSGAIARLLAFASAPTLRDLPSASLTRSAVRWAAAQGEGAAERLAGWCLGLRQCLDDCVDAEADDRRDAAFLDALAGTDFPVLLLWSNPDLARRLFVAEGEAVRVAPAFAADPKARRKAATAALRYALGTFGRFGPRDGWIGSGFAVADGAGEPARIEHVDERLVIEPDIAWAARTWFPCRPGGILPGEDAWRYLRRKLKGNGKASAALARLQASANALEESVWSFAAVDAFQRAAAARLAEVTGAERASADPHRWWISRVATRELHVRRDLLPACGRLYAATRADFLRGGVAGGAPAPAAGPFPLRSGADGVICTAEEISDWVLSADSLRQARGAFLPEQPPTSAAVVIHADGGGACYRLHEPNPRRTADIAARFLERTPHYLRCDASIAIAPPERLSDQRLLRPVSPETVVERVPAGRDAMFRLPLAGADSAAQLAREMASPRYAETPDLLPILFDEGAARPLGFGRLDPLNRVWLLPPGEAAALAAELDAPGRLAAFYRLELEAALGAPEWVGVLVAGKMSRMPTRSPAGFRWLLHACRTAATPIVLRAEACRPFLPLLVDGEGRPLACEIYAAAVEPAAAPARRKDALPCLVS